MTSPRSPRRRSVPVGRVREARVTIMWLVSCAALSGCAWALSDNFHIGDQAQDAGSLGSPNEGFGGTSSTGSTWRSSDPFELGGVSSVGGNAAVGGASDTGGVAATGGASETGGAAAGGASETGGAAVGGASETGGTEATGGWSGSLGTFVAGGTQGTEGSITGGSPNTSTVPTFGGAVMTGGRAPTGGLPATGGTAAGGSFNPFGGRTWGTTTSNSQYAPLCAPSVAKDEPCYAAAGAVCYKTCGPSGIGFKSEICQSGFYVEQSGCSFPSGVDYSCYSLPNSLPSVCPHGTPQASQACQVPQCSVCYGGTFMSPTYRDSTGTQKNGYCVCGATGTWTCASTSSWPCPASSGCD